MAGKKKPPKSKLIQALEFLRLMGRVIDDRGTYGMFESHTAIAFNGIVAAGTTIEEELNCCPQLSLLQEALEQSGARYVITQLSPEKLLVRSEGDQEFQAYIPCLLRTGLPAVIPDALAVPIDDRLIVALRKCVPLLNPLAETVLEMSIQLNAGSCLATNRAVLVEAWHGLDLPSGLLLPKNIVVAIHKSKKHLKGFGCSKETATFYFEDDTWLRTQLFQDRWPVQVTSYLNSSDHNVRKVPPQLFDAANKVAPFSSGHVFIKDGLISSHPFDVIQEGSSLKLPIGSEHKERYYSIDNLDFVSPFAEWWDEDARPDATYFVGKEVRGLIAHQIPQHSGVTDDDIPF